RSDLFLRPDPDKLASKGIKSVSSRVGNLRELLPSGSPLAALDGEGFFEELKRVFAREYVPAEPPAEIVADAARLREKYLSWDWNRGKSPAFSTEKTRRFPFGRITAGYEADRGRITKIAFTGDFIGDRDVAELENRLTGVPLSRDALLPPLSDSSDFFAGSTPEDLLSLIL
ncbi:MAG: hypothetical protein J6V01_04370, partial [Clostridia bacterium]|nr:hypothetical protein [Clostridia bacterium]